MSRVVDSRRRRVLGSKWDKLMKLRTKVLDRVKVAFTRVLGAFDTGATGCIIIYVEQQVGCHEILSHFCRRTTMTTMSIIYCNPINK